MMSSGNNGFTASDIERYHSGKLLPEERHALEKAALDDPFLADALEGYVFTSTPSDDLAKIQTRLDEKLNRKKVVPLFQKYRWLSVAAILLVIAGTAWLAYNIIGKEKQNFTALEKKLPEKDTSSIVASPQNTLNDSVQAKKNPVSNESVTNQVKVPDNKMNEIKSGQVSKKPANISNEKEVTQNSNSEIASKTLSAPSPQNEIASNNNRLSNAQRSNVNLNKAATVQPRLNNVSNDASRNEMFYKKADTNNGLTGRIIGTVSTDTIKNVNVVLQPVPEDSLYNTVVVGYGSQRKLTPKYPRVVIDTLEPEEGYENFDDYITDNYKMPEELKLKSVSGDVQLSFDVDRQGQATNITVVKSLCQKCDEEAIRLLKEGPKWKNKKNKKGKITIKF